MLEKFIPAILAGTYGLVLAYPFAGAPAAMCGFTYALILKKFTSKNLGRGVRCLVGAALGATCAGLFSAAFFLGATPQNEHSDWLAWVLAGLAGGGVSALTVAQNLYELVVVDNQTKHAT